MVTRLQADSGFFHMDFIRWLIWRGIEFYVIVPQLVYIQKLVLTIGTWWEVSPNVAVGETFLLLNSQRKLRLVLVRKTARTGKKARKQLKLFKVQPVACDYQVISTSSLDTGETCVALIQPKGLLRELHQGRHVRFRSGQECMPELGWRKGSL